MPGQEEPPSSESAPAGGEPGGLTGRARRVTRDATWVAATATVAQAGTLVLSVVLRRELGPVGMGYLAIALLAVTYAPFAALGTMQAAEREIAVALGAARDDVAAHLESVGLLVSIAAGLVALAAGIFLASVASSVEEALTVLTVGFVILTQQIAGWSTVRLRTRLMFRTLGIWSAFGSIMLILAPLLGAWLSGVAGALVGVGVGSVFQSAVLARGAGLRIPRDFDRGVLRRLAGLAPAFLGLGVASVAFMTIDQVAVGVQLGATALGLYSAAYLGNLFLLRIANTIGSVIGPHLQRDIGASRLPSHVHESSRRTSSVTLVFMPLLVALMVIGLPVVVRVALPAFTTAIPAMRLLLVGVVGLAFAAPATQVLVALGRQSLQAIIVASFVAAMVAAYVAAGAISAMTIDVAAGVDVVAYLLYGLVAQVAADRVAGVRDRWLRHVPWLYLLPTASLIATAHLTDVAGLWATPAEWTASIALQGLVFGIVWGITAARFLMVTSRARSDIRDLVDAVGRRRHPGGAGADR